MERCLFVVVEPGALPGLPVQRRAINEISGETAL